ncbi:MAG: hypothetical protein KatS3mg058_1364 [Roseiflexus sp.]|nr:MAG: hypothetical protein KatS3mg058_1364 [Roseiflexus sp.]
MDRSTPERCIQRCGALRFLCQRPSEDLCAAITARREFRSQTCPRLRGKIASRRMPRAERWERNGGSRHNAGAFRRYGITLPTLGKRSNSRYAAGPLFGKVLSLRLRACVCADLNSIGTQSPTSMTMPCTMR